MSYLKFNNICKKYPNSDRLSVTDFNLEIKQGEFVVFVGPSGCGKSTTLRMLAGLEEISDGEIEIDGEIVNQKHPKDRNISMVFQNYALYPHLKVYDNIGFSLKIQKLKPELIDEKVQWAAGLLGLTEYLDRKPKDLSGGQRQRVALGRAIVRNPKVFLMDEPLSNLDAKLRVSMRNEITKIHRNLNATTVYVTHDQVEAMTMADRIVVMKDGFIQQVGSPLELYEKPQNKFVAGFLGAPQMNFLDITTSGDEIIFEDGQKIKMTDYIKKIIEKYPRNNFILGVRPDHIRTELINIEALNEQVININVDNVEKMGNVVHAFSFIGNSKLICNFSSKENIGINDSKKAAIDLSHSYLIDPETEEVLYL